jgi:hypothetical protein
VPVDPATIAVGLLERLWHFTITSAKRGDIGQHDDELIAEACGWVGEPADLVAMLVETGWLDECPEHRLVVHDWHDHAPHFVRKHIHRAGGFVQSAPTRGDDDAKPSPRGDDFGASPPQVGQIASHVGLKNGNQPNLTNQTKEITPSELFPGDAAEPASAGEGSGVVFPVVSGPTDKRRTWELPQSLLDRYRECYGESLNVDQEIRNAQAWLEASPKRRKTRGGMQRFLTSWLMRRVNGQPPSGPQLAGRRHTEITPL